jgi:hypothetical protein
MKLKAIVKACGEIRREQVPVVGTCTEWRPLKFRVDCRLPIWKFRDGLHRLQAIAWIVPETNSRRSFQSPSTVNTSDHPSGPLRITQHRYIT